MNFHDRPNSEYVSYVGVDRKAVEFISKKTLKNSHTNTQFYILVQIISADIIYWYYTHYDTVSRVFWPVSYEQDCL